MAVDQPSSSLTQAIRSVRWVVNSLNQPLASLTLSLDDLAWDDAALPLVGFDPLAQFSPPATPEQAATDEGCSAHSAQSVWPSPPLSPSEFFQGVSPPSVANSITAPTTPVFSLRPRSSGSAARSPSNPPVKGVDLPNPVSKAAQGSWPVQPIEPQPRQNALTSEAQPVGALPSGDRPLIPQSPGASLSEWSSVSFSSPSVAVAIAASPTPITTVTLIEQVVNQLLSGSADAVASSSTTSSSPLTTAYSTSNPADLMSFQSSLSSASSTTSSASVPLPVARSVLDLMAGNWMEELAPSAIAPVSQAPDFNAGVDLPEFATPHAETPLAEMAETLTLLVNDVLTEQARRHGVDLS